MSSIFNCSKISIFCVNFGENFFYILFVLKSHRLYPKHKICHYIYSYFLFSNFSFNLFHYYFQENKLQNLTTKYSFKNTNKFILFQIILKLNIPDIVTVGGIVLQMQTKFITYNQKNCRPTDVFFLAPTEDDSLVSNSDAIRAQFCIFSGKKRKLWTKLFGGKQKSCEKKNWQKEILKKNAVKTNSDQKKIAGRKKF